MADNEIWFQSHKVLIVLGPDPGPGPGQVQDWPGPGPGQVQDWPGFEWGLGDL